MEKCNPNAVPAAPKALGADKDGPPMSDKWNYKSVVGMLLYLATNSRIDIAYAVSQVARFSANPRQSHATAVKMIARYLAGSIDRGTVIKPTKDFKLDCYVDADFLGLHGSEHQDDPTSANILFILFILFYLFYLFYLFFLF